MQIDLAETAKIARQESLVKASDLRALEDRS